ncbi:2197_t:CDS:2 [Ambispora leptoticha]|uniref:2197_t:CDS:1 n=1 Tax=Ambispora leptoticha TaxID=144679 RepID=A0A9N9H921_9GLOM|nr:2197_t:CDS:2 [Ambispora leptoticha]
MTTTSPPSRTGRSSKDCLFSEFDETRRRKAQEILDNWKGWCTQVNRDKLKSSDVLQVKKIKQFNNLTGDFATQNFDNRRVISRKHPRDADGKENTEGAMTLTKKVTNMFHAWNKVTTNDIVQGQSETEVAKKNNKTDELFQYMRKRNIYVLCGPFRKLSELDAEDRFEKIVHDTTVTKKPINPHIKEYLHDLLSGDIESALSKVKEPLSKDARSFLLWTNEVCRHFIFYFYYGGLQIDGDEKNWSNQTVYRILDLFSIFFGNLTSGIAFGEIVNEAHKDRIYTTNVDQK